MTKIDRSVLRAGVFLAAAGLVAAGATAASGASASSPAVEPVSAATAPADVSQKIDDAVTSGQDSFTYDSTWGTASGVSDLYDGTVHWNNATNGVGKFTFSGTSVALLGVRDVDQGIVTFSLDGGAATTVDDYQATRSTQSTLFSSDGLTEGTHTVVITATGTKNPASTNHTVAIDAAVVVGPPPPPPTLTADLGAPGAAFAPTASGTLYGIYQPGVPSDNLVAGMGQLTISTKAQDGQQHPGADALSVEPAFVKGGGKDEYIYMTDVYRAYPYDRTSYAQYQGFMTTEVKQVLAAGANDHIVFIPYNEPDGEWFNGINSNSTVLAAFEAEWLSTYKLIKSLDPTARIAGPGEGHFDARTTSNFLTYCKANACVPDVMIWHELSSPTTIRSDVAAYRSIEKTVGVGPLPINISEYGLGSDEDDPATMVPWISALDDSGVYGDLAYWEVDGSLNDSAAQQNTPNAQWWLYNWYSQMTGQKVTLTPSTNNAGGTPQGVATLDTATKTARVILSGGGRTGAVNTVVKNIPSSVFGSSVHVTVQEDAWSGDTGAANAPLRLSDADVPVVDGTITVPIDASAMSAYEITVQPGGTGSKSAVDSGFRKSYEAEDASLSGTGFNINTEKTGIVGNATSGGKDVGGLRTGSTTVITFHVSVPATADYDIRTFAGSNASASGVQGPTNVYLRADGGASTEVWLPASYHWTTWNNVDTTVHLTAGDHDISLATTGDNGGATAGDAIIDKIDVSQITSPTTVYEAEQAHPAGASTSFASRGQSGAGTAALNTGDTATFWVDSATDGYSKFALRYLGSGAAKTSVNGQSAEALGLSGTDDTTWKSTSGAVYLEQGINRIVVTGTSGTIQLDDLSVTPYATGDTVVTSNTQTVQAESGTFTGITAIDKSASQANGSAVTDIGPGQANSLTIATTAPAAGQYEMTLRFANNQSLPSNHYNPDFMDRTAQFSVNGGSSVQSVAFGPTYSWNQFFTVTVPVTLKPGKNTIKLWSDQQYNFDGFTVGTVGPVVSGGAGVGAQMRSNQAANIDQITFAPLIAKK